MSDDLEETQTYFAPKTQEELDEMLAGMGSNRPIRTMGATLSPTLRDEMGNPVPVDASGEPIYFEANPDYDPNAKPSWANARKNIGEMAEGVGEFFSAPLSKLSDAGSAIVQSGKDYTNRVGSGNATLGDVFSFASTLFGAGPATSIATKGTRATLDDLSDTRTSRIFLTPSTPNLSEQQRVGYLDAQSLAAQGADPLTIKQQTGWENLAGKEWVFEIDDSKAETFETSLANNATRDVEFKVPGGTASGQERRSMLLQAQRDMINLKKQLQAGALTEDEFVSLSEARQRALDNELSSRSEERTVSRQVPLTPQLKRRGSLDQTFYHPELKDYADTSGYTAKVGTIQAPKTSTGVTLGEHDKYNKSIIVYRQDDKVKDKAKGKEERRDTMVHEVQHLVDSQSNSPGSGFNKGRSNSIREAALDRYKQSVSQFYDTKLDSTVEYYNIFNFGPPLTNEDFVLSLSSSVTIDPQTGRRFISEQLLKDELAERGNTDPDLTLRTFKEQRPENWADVEEFGSILTGRDATLASMSDFQIYEMELGEIKARLAARRSRMDPEERANSLATPDIRLSDEEIPVDLSRIFTPDEYR